MRDAPHAAQHEQERNARTYGGDAEPWRALWMGAVGVQRATPTRALDARDRHDVVLIVQEARLGVDGKVEEVVNLLLRESLAVRRQQRPHLLRLNVPLVLGVERLQSERARTRG